ncbi:hypothetical protein GGF41_006947 [Coemansia sp. RSA 2531]|nr:hypothetical protein GGF41_006947 [Coemansia sp. RSA 2531]
MDHHTHEGNSPDEPDHGQLWHILETFADIIDVLECAHEGQDNLRTRVDRIVNLIASPRIIATASRNSAKCWILRYLHTLSPSKILCRRLVYVASKRTSTHIKNYL